MPPNPSPPPRIFLSYSRADRDFAVVLRDEMIAAGHAVWHDLKDMGAGQWWDQIADQLRASSSIEHIVLVVSPEAIASRIVEREWRLAKREGKTLSAVVPPAHKGRIDFTTLRSWMKAEHHYNFAEDDQRARLISDLIKPGQQPRRPDPLRRLPEAEGYVRRTTKIAEIKAALLDERREAKATTVVLSGAGGFGKSTLAIDIMNDAEIQDACFDGILWVELHEELVRIAKGPRGAEALRDAIKAKIESLIRDLTGDREVLDDLDRAKERLGQLLANKHVLLVIDDAWDKGHAKHFIEAAPEAAKLVTTRRTDIVGDAIIGVDQLSEDEALDLISLRLTPAPAAAEKVLLRALALGRAGGWPLLLRLINGQLRLATTARPGWSAKPLAKAVADLTATFDREGLKALDEENRDRAVRLSVGVSFEMLRDEDQHREYPPGFHEARYLDLAGFQEAKVPIATIARLWAHLGALKSKSVVLDAKSEAQRDAQEAAFREAAIAESVAVLERLYALALLQSLDAADDNGMVQLHDVMRTYLGEVQGDEARNKFHRQFVLAYDADSGERVSDMGERERRYFYTWYPAHLAAADKIDRGSRDQSRPFREALDGLLLDPLWMQRKLNALKSPPALVADYDAHAAGPMQALIGRTLRLTTSILARDNRQLLPQLHGRLMACVDPEASAFLAKTRNPMMPPALFTQRLSLTPPGAETIRLQGHKRGVSSLTMMPLPDGRLASGAGDGSVRLWDLKSGTETACFEGQARWVYSLAALPDGRLVSGDSDGSVRVWDVNAGTETARLELGPGAYVSELVALPDGRLVTGDGNGLVKLWDLVAGNETVLHTGIAGLESRISALDVLPDGRLAICEVTSDPDRGLHHEDTIWVWDPVRGTKISALKFRTMTGALAILGDGRLAIGMSNRVELWDLETSAETGVLTGHTGNITALAVLPDSRLASGSEDKTVRVWDLNTCTEIAHFKGHTATVEALTVLTDGRLASGSDDTTVRLWDLAPSKSSLQGPDNASPIKALAMLADNQLASGSHDGTIRLWDPLSGSETSRLEGPTAQVNALVLLRDGRLASAYNETLSVRVWDPRARTEDICIRDDRIMHAVLRGAQKRLSRLSPASAKSTDSQYVVNDLGIIQQWGDMHLNAADNNGVIQQWGNIGYIISIAVLQGHGLVALGSDDGTIRLWDLEKGLLVRRLEGHQRAQKGVKALAMLPDGRLASTAGDGSVRLWDVNTGTETACIEGHGSEVIALAVLPDGRLSSGGGDGSVRLWDVKTGAETARLEGHANSVMALTVLPDGRLASGSTDNTIRLWDPKSSKEIMRLEVDAPVWCLAALPGIDGIGLRLVAGDALGRLHWLEIVD